MPDEPEWMPSYQPPDAAAIDQAKHVLWDFTRHAFTAIMFLHRRAQPFLGLDDGKEAHDQFRHFQHLHARTQPAISRLVQGASIAAAEDARRYEGKERPALLRLDNDDTLRVFAPYVRKAEKELWKLSRAVDRLIAQCAVQIGGAPQGPELVQEIRRLQWDAGDASNALTQEARTGAPLPAPVPEAVPEQLAIALQASFGASLMQAMSESQQGVLADDPNPVWPLSARMSAIYRRTGTLVAIAADRKT